MLTNLEGNPRFFEVFQFIWKDCQQLESYLENIFFDGGRSYLSIEIKIYAINHFNNYYGFNYWIDGSLVGQIHLSSLQNGQFVLYRRTFLEDKLTEQFDYFYSTGEHNYSSFSQSLPLQCFDHILMETNSPIADFFYNYLADQFDKATEGLGDTQSMLFSKSILQKKFNEGNLNVNSFRKDPSLEILFQQLIEKEKDSILNYQERNIAHKNLISKITKIVNTKSRVHHLKNKKYRFPILAKRLSNYRKRFLLRPKQNIKGTIYKYTIGILVWFLSTVKNNLGYSIALAIYGPFTFYFITQPMNPHAMWAVGKVRNSIIEITDSLSAITTATTSVESTYSKQIQNNQTETQTQNQTPGSNLKPLPPIKPVKDQVTFDHTQLPVGLQDRWYGRMDQFKAVQIQLEENMIHAVRMGRLEQIDTQMGFSTLAESLHNSLLEYEEILKSKRNQLSTAVSEELKLILDIKKYLYNRLIQFCADYPFILMDVSGEQRNMPKQGQRIFSLITKVEKDLKLNKVQTKRPAYFKMILEKSKDYQKNLSSKDSLMLNLKSNTELFAQNDFFDTNTLRNKQMRNWETVFLQQNKKQEAASFALIGYVWSIRHSLWNMQQIISVKLSELYRHILKNGSNQKMDAIIKSNNSYLESLVHYMVYDFTSIYKEYKVLKNDNEIEERKSLIRSLIKNLELRNKLYDV